MKSRLLLCLLLALGISLVRAQSLKFTSGTVLSNNTVRLVVDGPTNQTYWLEWLNRTNQTWEIVSTYSLPFSPATLTNALSQGNYGFFRTRSTNSSLLSTNAFGAVVGTVGKGYTLLGNPFGGTTLTNILPQPPDGISALQWRPATSNYFTADYYDGIGWTTNLTITELEGLFVYNPNTNAVRYVFSGLFGTNAWKYLPAGDSLITSQRLNLLTPSTGQSDLLQTNLYGGYSGLPVLTPGFNPQCRIDRYVPASGTYNHYVLTNLTTTNLVWRLNGTNTTVPLYLAEGFFITKYTNTWWQISRPIW